MQDLRRDSNEYKGRYFGDSCSGIKDVELEPGLLWGRRPAAARISKHDQYQLSAENRGRNGANGTVT